MRNVLLTGRKQITKLFNPVRRSLSPVKQRATKEGIPEFLNLIHYPSGFVILADELS